MKAVVTGGAGFIGSHLVELLLDKGLDVTVIDNLSTGRLQNIAQSSNKIRFIEQDLSVADDRCRSELRDAEYVFHLASLADIVPSIEAPRDYFEANVVSTLNIVESLDPKRLKKLVYAASSSCYGIPDTYPTPESAEINPQYPYALTKRMGEELVLHWSKVYGIEAVSTRFFNVYGTRSRTSGTYGAVLGVFLAQKLNGKPLTIVGDGSQSRDFTYVTDVCNGMWLASQSGANCDIFNIGSGKPQTINYLAKLIGGEITYIPKRPGEPDITHADISKARSILGYDPKVSFESGVSLVIDNIEYWREAPVWTPETIHKATSKWFDALS